MSVGAVVLLQSSDPALATALRARGLYVRVLADGALLVNSLMNFAGFQRNRAAAAVWLRSLGELSLAPVDPRGVLMIPDTLDPSLDSYPAVVGAAEAAGFWVDPHGESEDEVRPMTETTAADIEALAELTRRLKAEPNVSLEALLEESWPPIVREQLRHLLARKK